MKSGLGFDLPEDYVLFLRNFSGTTPEPASFRVDRGEHGWGSEIDQLYVMARGNEPQSLLIALDWDGLPLKPGMIPIGDDGSFCSS